MERGTAARDRILVIGGSGLIGSHIVARLVGEGRQVVGVGRNACMARRRTPLVDWRDLDLGKASAEDWREILERVVAVVNCAGALQDGPGDDLTAVHVSGIETLLAACETAGVRRFVQISASTVEHGDDAFRATKRRGDARVAGSSLDWLILRPGLVLAPSAYGGSALLRGLAGFPGVIPAVHARARLRIVGVADLVEAVVRALAPGGPRRLTLDLVSEDAVELGSLLTRLRAWLGFRPAPLFQAPAWVARLVSRCADGLAWLGWRSALRSAALIQLEDGVDGRPADAARLGVRIRTLDRVLAASPSSLQDRRHARTYFVRPLALAGLAGFWLASGLIGWAFRSDAAAVLADAGMAPAPAMALVWSGVAVDVVLGGAVLVRRTSSAALVGMIAITAGYLAAATVWRPDLWADPLGPLVKTFPAALLAMCALAMRDDR